MSAKSKKSSPKRFRDMTLDELRAATAEYDAETPDVLRTTKPPTRTEKARLNRVVARSKGAGRPAVGEGAERINVTVERSLLKQADNFADSRGMTRSQLIAVGLRMAMRARASA